VRRWLGLVLACGVAVDPAAAITVEKLLGGGRLVAYAPTGYDPATTRRLGARGLNSDAESLLRLGFRAITTYGAARPLVPVCRFFKRRGFRTVLVGIWDPTDRDEVRRAIRLRRCADGYVVGNEGLTFGRYERDALAAAVARVRKRTGRPVTTRETLKAYADDPSLVRLGDWVFPTIHPWYADRRDPQAACGWTIFAWRDLIERVPAGLPTVIAETGLPTAGAAPASEHYQRAFFACLESRSVDFAFFEAFDQPWKTDDAVGPHWGLFRADGTPKLWAAQEGGAPELAARRQGATIRGRTRGAIPRALDAVVYVQDGAWRALPPVPLDRRGGFTVEAPPDRPAAVYVVVRGWTAPSPAPRAPQIDRSRVLARRELPPAGR
jgi:exo-beta-1,3-glucanase (GH17 family)